MTTPPGDDDTTDAEPHEPGDAEGGAPSPPRGPRALYTSEQQRVLHDALIAGTLPACPACGGTMTRRPIGGGSFGLGYARRREWLLCAGCHRSVIFDVRRGTRT